VATAKCRTLCERQSHSDVTHPKLPVCRRQHRVQYCYSSQIPINISLLIVYSLCVTQVGLKCSTETRL